MDPLHRQAIVQGLFGILFFVVLIFWPAGTFDYWQGWLFLGIFVAATVGFTVYLAIFIANRDGGANLSVWSGNNRNDNYVSVQAVPNPLIEIKQGTNRRAFTAGGSN